VSCRQRSWATQHHNRTSCRYAPSEKSTQSIYLIRVVIFLILLHHFLLSPSPSIHVCDAPATSLCATADTASGPYHPSYNTNICRPTHPYFRWSFRYYWEVLVFLHLLTLEYSYIFIAMNFMCESSALLQVGTYYYRIGKTMSGLFSWNLKCLWMSILDDFPLMIFFSCFQSAEQRNGVFTYLELSRKILFGYKTVLSRAS